MGTVAGTTSACAENTSEKTGHSPSRGNYLRVRGEYDWEGDTMRNQKELPPRARRILKQNLKVAHEIGTTSACAENTAFSRSPAV